METWVGGFNALLHGTGFQHVGFRLDPEGFFFGFVIYCHDVRQLREAAWRLSSGSGELSFGCASPACLAGGPCPSCIGEFGKLYPGGSQVLGRLLDNVELVGDGCCLDDLAAAVLQMKSNDVCNGHGMLASLAMLVVCGFFQPR